MSDRNGGSDSDDLTELDHCSQLEDQDYVPRTPAQEEDEEEVEDVEERQHQPPTSAQEDNDVEEPEPEKKGRGRPKGAQNRSQNLMDHKHGGETQEDPCCTCSPFSKCGERCKCRIKTGGYYYCRNCSLESCVNRDPKHIPASTQTDPQEEGMVQVSRARMDKLVADVQRLSSALMAEKDARVNLEKVVGGLVEKMQTAPKAAPKTAPKAAPKNVPPKAAPKAALVSARTQSAVESRLTKAEGLVRQAVIAANKAVDTGRGLAVDVRRLQEAVKRRSPVGHGKEPVPISDDVPDPRIGMISDAVAANSEQLDLVEKRLRTMPDLEAAIDASITAIDANRADINTLSSGGSIQSKIFAHHSNNSNLSAGSGSGSARACSIQEKAKSGVAQPHQNGVGSGSSRARSSSVVEDDTRLGAGRPAGTHRVEQSRVSKKLVLRGVQSSSVGLRSRVRADWMQVGLIDSEEEVVSTVIDGPVVIVEMKDETVAKKLMEKKVRILRGSRVYIDWEKSRETRMREREERMKIRRDRDGRVDGWRGDGWTVVGGSGRGGRGVGRERERGGGGWGGGWGGGGRLGGGAPPRTTSE
jgi:hypothetical protein